MISAKLIAFMTYPRNNFIPKSFLFPNSPTFDNGTDEYYINDRQTYFSERDMDLVRR